jgi:hypothetical protein
MWVDMKIPEHRPDKEGFYFVRCRSIITGSPYLQVARFYRPDSEGRMTAAFCEGDNSYWYDKGKHPTGFVGWDGNFDAYWMPGPLEEPAL